MQNKSILITGSSSGIGLATALYLKQQGYRVFATARKEKDVENLRQLGLDSLVLDVSDSHSIQQALNTILSQTNGELYAVFNNAGFLQAGAAEDVSRDMMRKQFETNTFGAMELTQLVLPIMRKQGYGRIIQNSSILGIIAMPYYGAYNASKFALEGYSNTLRQELRGTNIHVSIIAPGPITSKLRASALHHYQNTIRLNQSGAYTHIYQKMEKSYFPREQREDKLTLQPDAVAMAVHHALESKRPKAHYYIGIAAKFMAFLRRVLPDSALDWFIAKIR